MTPDKLIPILRDAIANKEQLLIVGPPGVGKTDIVKQVCAELNADVIISHPAVSDPTDYKGLPLRAQDNSHAEFLPFGETYRAINAQKLTVWFLDDLGQASEAVQKALMQLLLGRRLNGHKLSEQVVFIGATNDTSDRAGVSGLLEPVKSRWDSIIHLEPSLAAWCDWALKNNMPIELIAYMRSCPESLCQFVPTRALVNSPLPRTWASIGRFLRRSVRDFDLFAGTVGKGKAMEFLAFLKLAENAPSIDSIILNPQKAPVPKEPSICYLVVSGLAHRMDKKNISKIFTYLQRMTEPYRVLCIREAVSRDQSIAETESFIAWCTSEEGKAINGGAEDANK